MVVFIVDPLLMVLYLFSDFVCIDLFYVYSMGCCFE